jgi:uracil-DNA glycosylase family 4
MPILVPPSGPSPARLMIVGEAPGIEEELKLQPFVGASGQELDRMLRDAGIIRSEAFVTNVSKIRPPSNDINNFIAKSKVQVTARHVRLRDKWVTPEIWDGVKLLEAEIKAVKPNVILALGNTAMWALTGKWGIKKWRGSMLVSDLDLSTKVIPSYHPAAVLRQWDTRPHAVIDFRRAGRFLDGQPYPKPKWNFRLRPNIQTVVECFNEIRRHLEAGPTRLSFDIETRGGHTACTGISWTLVDAICIPFSLANRIESYWSLDEETYIIYELWKLLTHPNAQVVGQNIIYDCQYTWRHNHFVPRVAQDCMISQHSLFSDLPKSLAFQASMYCDYYVYWKDEGKVWDEAMGEESLWHYNCLDCVYTDEVGLVELETAKKMKLEEVHQAQQDLLWPVLRTMIQGVRIDTQVRDRLIIEVEGEISKRKQFIKDVLGHPLNPASPKQMKALFYEDLKQPVIFTRATKDKPATPTLGDEALVKIALREPLLKPLITAISDIRTLAIFLSNFLLAPLGDDGRLRCSYNIGGSASGKTAPKTYRLSSSEDAFGGGANLQTIPSEKSKSLNKAKARGTIALLGDPYAYPNLRTMFIPDPGKTFWDADLDRADLQVVCWEADDEMLKQALRQGVDIHLLNAYVLNDKSIPPMEELVETHSKYLDHRGPLKSLREFAKTFCHGTNYLGQSRTMSAHTGWTVHAIERAQATWFGAHPGIKKWHERVIAQVSKYRFVENRFNYRWHIFDRTESIMPEAVAWIPQSTVSVVINKIWKNLDPLGFDGLYKDRDIEVGLQVHDSLAGQFPTEKKEACVKEILRCGRIIIPYEDPLVIPFSVKTSEISWGECA